MIIPPASEVRVPWKRQQIVLHGVAPFCKRLCQYGTPAGCHAIGLSKSLVFALQILFFKD